MRNLKLMQINNGINSIKIISLDFSIIVTICTKNSQSSLQWLLKKIKTNHILCVNLEVVLETQYILSCLNTQRLRSSTSVISLLKRLNGSRKQNLTIQKELLQKFKIWWTIQFLNHSILQLILSLSFLFLAQSVQKTTRKWLIRSLLGWNQEV